MTDQHQQSIPAWTQEKINSIWKSMPDDYRMNFWMMRLQTQKAVLLAQEGFEDMSDENLVIICRELTQMSINFSNEKKGIKS